MLDLGKQKFEASMKLYRVTISGDKPLLKLWKTYSTSLSLFSFLLFYIFRAYLEEGKLSGP